jgi:hypothetical protein
MDEIREKVEIHNKNISEYSRIYQIAIKYRSLRWCPHEKIQWCYTQQLNNHLSISFPLKHIKSHTSSLKPKTNEKRNAQKRNDNYRYPIVCKCIKIAYTLRIEIAWIWTKKLRIIICWLTGIQENWYKIEYTWINNTHSDRHIVIENSVTSAAHWI